MEEGRKGQCWPGVRSRGMILCLLEMYIVLMSAGLELSVPLSLSCCLVVSLVVCFERRNVGVHTSVPSLSYTPSPLLLFIFVTLFV